MSNSQDHHRQLELLLQVQEYNGRGYSSPECSSRSEASWYSRRAAYDCFDDGDADYDEFGKRTRPPQADGFQKANVSSRARGRYRGNPFQVQEDDGYGSRSFLSSPECTMRSGASSYSRRRVYDRFDDPDDAGSSDHELGNLTHGDHPRARGRYRGNQFPMSGWGVRSGQELPDAEKDEVEIGTEEEFKQVERKDQVQSPEESAEAVQSVGSEETSGSASAPTPIENSSSK